MAVLAWWLLSGRGDRRHRPAWRPHLALALAALLPSVAVLMAMILAQIGHARDDRRDRSAGRDATAPSCVPTSASITNTIEQLALFVPALLALAAGAPAARMAPIVALAWVFALARLAFWAGYLAGARLRAPGMAATFVVNVATLVGAAWVWV